MAGMISENAQKLQNKSKMLFRRLCPAKNFPKNQENSQLLKSTQGYALSTNGGGEFLSCL